MRPYQFKSKKKWCVVMCGRFAFWVTRKRPKEEFDLPGPEDALPEIPARYNIAPGTDIAAVRNLPDKPRELAMLRWGLIPSWAKDKKTDYKMINARTESVIKKPAFRNAFRYRRCLIPASCFCEWQKRPSANCLEVPCHFWSFSFFVQPNGFRKNGTKTIEVASGLHQIKKGYNL